jgi:hypothetical protein
MNRLRLALALTLFAALSLTALAEAGSTAKITGDGVGKVKVGMTHKKARELGLVGKIRRGCELGGPKTRSAKLKAPLKGGVNYTTTKPYKITDVFISSATAKARGVGVGDTIREIRNAFPKAKVDHSTDETFLLTLVKIPKNGGGRIVFGVDTQTDKVTIVGVPHIAFCE